jgi:hypothetical protein
MAHPILFLWLGFFPFETAGNTGRANIDALQPGIFPAEDLIQEVFHNFLMVGRP